MNTAGMPSTPYFSASAASSSTLTFPTTTRPWYSSARAEMVGASARQGPHQGAQKSTTTGLVEASTCCWKLAAVSLTMLVLVSCWAELVPTWAQPAARQASNAAAPVAEKI